MADNNSDFATRLNAMLKGLGAGKLMALALILAGTIAGFIYIVVWSGKADLQNLYSNLTPEDAGHIVSRMKEQKIPYKLTAGGGTVMAPSDRIFDLRLEFASQGLPQGSGVGFEVFDNTKIGMTEFVQNVNYQRALQGELSRTINSFDEVDSSRIHIVIPPKRLFIEDDEPSSASVILKLRRGRWLEKEQIDGIVHLVSSSVTRLKPENVTIVDNFGKLLAGKKGRSEIGKASSEQLEHQQQLEKSLEDRVSTMLQDVLGRDKATVRVSCLLDFRHHEKTEELYMPDNLVVRSEQINKEVTSKGGDITGGVPGLSSYRTRTQNAEGTETVEATPTHQKEQLTRNHEIGKVINHEVMPVGSILRLSVAVAVDGRYEDVEVKGKKKGETKVENKYFPRTEEEMTQLENIVKSAVNFDPERGDNVVVTNIPFAGYELIEEEPEPQGWTTTIGKYTPPVKHVFPAIFVIMAFLFVVRPIVKWFTSISVTEAQILDQLPMTIQEIESEYAGAPGGGAQGSLPLTAQASQVVMQNQDGSAELMKDWLRET